MTSLTASQSLCFNIYKNHQNQTMTTQNPQKTSECKHTNQSPTNPTYPTLVDFPITSPRNPKPVPTKNIFHLLKRKDSQYILSVDMSVPLKLGFPDGLYFSWTYKLPKNYWPFEVYSFLTFHLLLCPHESKLFWLKNRLTIDGYICAMSKFSKMWKVGCINTPLSLSILTVDCLRHKKHTYSVDVFPAHRKMSYVFKGFFFKGLWELQYTWLVKWGLSRLCKLEAVQSLKYFAH